MSSNGLCPCQRTQVVIALGSNHLQSANMHWGAERLKSMLTITCMSRRLWTMDVKNTGCWYMNQLVTATTDMEFDELERRLKAIEQESQRTTQHVTLDLDILLYDTTRYHEKDWSRPYVQQLLPDLK